MSTSHKQNMLSEKIKATPALTNAQRSRYMLKMSCKYFLTSLLIRKFNKQVRVFKCTIYKANSRSCCMVKTKLI